MGKPLIVWSDNLVIDSGLIDSQHKKLVQLINDLYSAFLQGKANDISENIIEELVEYTVSHFQTEEKWFEEINYVNTAEHKKQHQDFVDSIIDFKNKLELKEVSLSYDIMNFLRKWLQEHILIEDRKYVPFL